ncbi:MAG: TerC family protein [Bacteroidetes bacterium]|nr:TerC family protein [Bacteroidota bacterium]
MLEWLELFTRPEAWISLVSLFAMLMVLDIDNVIFISVLTSQLPPERRTRARTYGLYIGLGMRVLFLLGVDFLIGKQEPLFTVFDIEFSIKNLILLAGGLFLLTKSTLEIHNKLEGPEANPKQKVFSSMGQIVTQLAILDLVFSVDAVVTAVGMVKDKGIMIVAILASMLVMFIFARKIGEFVHKHPTIKMLALSFLLLIGMLLVAEGLHVEVPKGYIYFAMAFSLFVELLNMRVRRHYTTPPPVELRSPTLPEENGLPKS